MENINHRLVILEQIQEVGHGNGNYLIKKANLPEGIATGGVSNLFQRATIASGKAVELVTKLPEFLKFVESRLLIKASE